MATKAGAYVVGLSLAALFACTACKKEAAEQALAPPPTSTAAQDALWALAPEGANTGIVVSPRGIEMIERGAIAIESLLDAAPDLAPLRAELRRTLEKTGVKKLALAEFGLGPAKGFALFTLDGKQAVSVLPVVDRDRFLAVAHGEKGTDHDTLDGDHCKERDGLYVCASTDALFDKIGRGALAPIVARAGGRGELEIASSRETPAYRQLAAVVQLANGGFILRGSLEGVPPEAARWIGAPSAPRAGAAGAAAFGVIDLAPYLAQLPSMPVVANVTTADLAASVAGPLTFAVAPGTTDPDLRVPLRDPAPFTQAIAACADLPPLAKMGATFEGGACHIAIPETKFTFDAWVEGTELRVGRRQPPVTPAAVLAPSPLARELAAGTWSIAWFGRGTAFSLGEVPEVAAMLKTMPANAMVLLRLMPLFNEFGVGVRKDGDALRFVAGARTAWSNPSDVVARLLAISTEDITSGAAAAKARAIADAAPTSPFASDIKAGAGAAIGMVAPIGIGAAVAVPAFMGYMKRAP